MKAIVCQCNQSHVVAECHVAAAVQELSAEGYEVRTVDDLCGHCAAPTPALREAIAAAQVVAACHPRAVRALLCYSNVTHAPDLAIRDLRLANGDDRAKIVKQQDTVLPPADISTDNDWPAWYPVIDTARCSNCGRCLSYCLFGVYEAGTEYPNVCQPSHCKNQCPACARICPCTAIIFPKLNESPLNGDEITDPEEMARQAADGADVLQDADIYAALAKRRARAKARLFGRQQQERADAEREACQKEARRMNASYGFRLLRQTTPRTLQRFVWNFGWQGMRAVQRFERTKRKEGKAWPPFLFISVTHRCNLRCQGCWVVDSDPTDMPLETLDRVIGEAGRNGTTMFGILGGEPLLLDGLLDVLAKHPRAYFLLFTNGTLLTSDLVRRMRHIGNISPLLSVEGSEDVSDVRRGGTDVHARTMEGLALCTEGKLVTGVAASICRSNIDDLATPAFVEAMATRGAHYLWYYIYRPAGPTPCRELLLRADQVLQLRRFITGIRSHAPLVVVDAYWDHEGNALCPAATGIGYHLSPEGFVEPCPVIQMARDSVGDGSRTFEAIHESTFLDAFNHFATANTRGCVFMEMPDALADFMKAEDARDTSGRGSFHDELLAASPCPCHHLPGQEIPEKDARFRFAKKHWFFGFGAYG